MSENNQPLSKGLELVIGIDGSGKSTFLNGLKEHLGYHIVEATSSPEAKAFKESNIDVLVDERYIAHREKLFLAINHDFDSSLRRKLQSGSNVATTGSSLVTRISHSLMRNVIHEGEQSTIAATTMSWLSLNPLLPEHITHITAPFSTIRQRIEGRQAQGHVSERFWGFNSLFYLERYQETWHGVLEKLITETDIQCITLDSSQLSPVEMIEKYANAVNL